MEQDSELLIADQRIRERTLLCQVLAINFFFFALEIIAGFISNSMGLVADSLDMLTDAIVYSMALYVVGKSIQHKRRIAQYSGYLQFSLALFGLIEVIRKYLGHGEVPVVSTMIIVSSGALIGNIVTLYLLQTSKSTEVHLKASIIFTSTDDW